ncbi:MAG: hypothetical protein IKV85_02225 [Ruminococcus sp.]|nr:hypothetical protein [Ruminococcus sp.]
MSSARDNKIPIEWYKRGLKFKRDHITKFMMHWIAFNWLYSEYRKMNRNNNGKKKHNYNDEKECIEKYVNNKIMYLKKYNAYSTDAYDKIINREGGIREGTNGDINDYVIEAYRKLKNRRNSSNVKYLFLIIYQIRCNLFHGSKSLNESDVKLVEWASVILEGYLEALFKNDSDFKELYKEIIGEHNNS